MIKDNNLWEYCKGTQSTDPDFIYFDEAEEEETRSTTTLGAREVITQIINASNGNTKVLHALLCSFAGLSLRETKKHINMSHEYVRQQIEKIKYSYPELYEVITDKYRYTVDALVPKGSTYKWKIKIDDVILHSNNLKHFCKGYKIPYSSLRKALYYNDGVYKNITIEKLY